MKTSFIGAGKMATALISSIYEKGITRSIIASDKNQENLSKLKAKYKIGTTTNNKEAAKNSDIIFLCVKPQDIDSVLHEIKNETKNKLVVSIAAGIKISHMQSVLKNSRIIRVMPNINCLAGEMAAGFSVGKHAIKEDVEIISKILNSAGIAFEVKEDLLDVVTGVSGSGPAFFAYFIDAIANEGIKNGLGKDIACKLAAQTALGTGKLILKNKISPDELIKMVASKKGTTEAGLKVLEKHKTKNILTKAVSAAIKRSKELGR